MKGKISIFMPVYNGSGYLDSSIPSVMGQSYRNWELLCVDDCSTDGSLEKLESYRERDGRIVVYRKPHGGNVPKSWNFILPKITGDYVMYMSQDDMLGTDALAQMAAAMAADADAVLPLYRQYDYGSKRVRRANGIDDVTGCLTGVEAFALSLKWHIHGFCLYRRALYEGVRLDDGIYISDEWLTRKLLLRARKVVASDAVFLRGNNPCAITAQPKAYRVEGLVANRYVLRLFDEHRLPVQLKIYWLAWCFRYLCSARAYIEAHSDVWTREEAYSAKKLYNSELKALKTKRHMLCVLLRKPFSTPGYIRRYCERNACAKVGLYLRKVLLFRYTSLLQLMKTECMVVE